MVLREGSEEKLASGLGEEPRFAVDVTASQYGDHGAGPLRVGSTTGSQKQRKTLSTRRPSSARCKGIYVPSNYTEENKGARGNDIDLLPSQVSRVSADEMNLSWNIDLGDTAAGSCQDRHWIASSKPQIVPSGGQVLLRGFEAQKDGDEFKANGASDKQPLASTGSTPIARDRIHKTDRTERSMVEQPATADPNTTDKPPKEDLEPILETKGLKLSSLGVKTGDTIDHSGIRVQKFSLESDQAAKRTRAASDTSYRRHKRHNAALDIFRDRSFDDSANNSIRLASASSGPPLITPQPTSPSLQLRIKNSIPKLMKALPALPMSSENIIEEKYLSSTEDNCSQVLQLPLGQPHLANPIPPRKESTAALPCPEASKINLSVQKRLRRIRLRSKEAGSDLPHAAIATPRAGTLPHTKQHRTQFPEEGFKTEEKFPREFNREKEPSDAKICPLVPPETVRWHPDARGSPAVAALATKPPKDLFTQTNRLATMFQQTSRREKDVQGDSNVVRVAESATRNHSLTTELGDGNAGLARRDEEIPSFRQLSGSPDLSTVVHARRLKKKISGIGWLVGRTGQRCWQDHPAGKQSSDETSEVLAGKMARIEANGSGKKGLTACRDTPPKLSYRQRLRRQIRNKISKWARETKNTMKGRGRIHKIDSVDRAVAV